MRSEIGARFNSDYILREHFLLEAHIDFAKVMMRIWFESYS